jgi:hypothetical protein
MNNTTNGRTSCHGDNKNDIAVKRRSLYSQYIENLLRPKMRSRVCCDVPEALTVRKQYTIKGYNQERRIYDVDELFKFLQDYHPDLVALRNSDIWISVIAAGNILRPGNKLSDYNFWHTDIYCSMLTISFYPRFRGGAVESTLKIPSDKLEAAALVADLQGVNTHFMELIHKFTEHLKGAQIDIDIVNLMENILLLAISLARSRDIVDITISAVSFIKTFCNGSLLSAFRKEFGIFISDLFPEVRVQGVNTVENWITGVENFRDLISKWEELKDTTIVKKFSKIMNYLVAFGMFAHFGIECDEDTTQKMNDAAKRKWVGVDFVFSLIDTITFTLQRVLMFIKTGEWSVFLHGPSQYLQWYDDCLKIKREAHSLGDLESQGTNYFKFVDSLKCAIDQGKAIVKFGSKKNTTEFRAARTMLNDVMIIEANVLTKKAAQQSRRTPFALLIHGRSSIAKTHFTNMMFIYHGKLLKLPIDSTFKYTRNPAEEHWSGFDSKCWCIQMDDIAYLSPTQNVDPTLNEIIIVINSVPLVPKQAALEDKGRTPVRAKLVLATTNTKDINAHAYFMCPLAVQRRLPWVITLTVKPEYRQADSHMVDPAKIPSPKEGWPDIWFIRVDRVVSAGTHGGREMAKHELVKEFSDVNLYLDWYKEVVFTFERNQGKSMKDEMAMKDFVLCDLCNRVKCDCVKLDDSSSSDEKSESGSLESDSGLSSCSSEYSSLSESSGISENTKIFFEENETERLRAAYTQVDKTAKEAFEAIKPLSTLLKAREERVNAQLKEAEDKSDESWDAKVNIQGGREVLLPKGYEYGDTFAYTEHEGGSTYIDSYFTDGTSKQYYCNKRVINRRGEEIMNSTGPVDVVKSLIVKTEIESGEDIADILDVVYEEMRKSTKSLGYIDIIMNKCVCTFLSCYLRYTMFRNFTDWVCGWTVVRNVYCWFVLQYMRENSQLRRAMQFMGRMREIAYMNRKWIGVVAVLSGSAVLFLAYNKYKNKDKEKSAEITPEEQAVVLSVNTTNEFVEEKAPDPIIEEPKVEVQGNKLPVPSNFFKKDEKENVWKRDDYETTTFDVNVASSNYASLPYEQVRAKIYRNMARMMVHGDKMRIPGNAFCVGGHLWVTNNHLIPKQNVTQITFIVEPLVNGVSRNVTFSVKECDFYRDEENDLIWFECNVVDVKADLTKLIAEDTYDGTLRTHLLGISKDGKYEDRTVKACHRAVVRCRDLEAAYRYWVGETDVGTVNGDCGSVMIVHLPQTIILGIHQMGGNVDGSEIVFSVLLTQRRLQMARTHFVKPIIQSGAPMLESDSVKKEVGPLSHKSPFRFLQSGNAAVYGSFKGFSNVPRSKVKSTLLGEEIKATRNWEVPFTKPDLKSWVPWHLAAKDTVDQSKNIETDVLEKATKSFLKDVISGLSKESLDTLQVLDDHAAINGIQGVKYIDKLNFNTSLGEPFRKSKKYHLLPCPTEELPDAKFFSAEIMSRVREIEGKYERGERAYPVFAGQLKDEPRHVEKVKLGKVRVFTGCPTDWGIVVRKNLLTFVKVVQENKLLFEAVPGTVVQSLEWEQFRDHLTEFGEDRIVAGDYGKFDKKMSPKIILAAFDIIVGVLKHAGWTDEELLPILCIAEDIAFPVVNFNNDLVMFYGSNPSGHPLTVIINSLVNSLYMRYCYIKLNPDEDCSSFKDNVNLITYGDDNTMGVSEEAEWFNHTAIVGKLKDIGVEYTMADKESESVPFINISQVAFLKRTWRFDNDINAWVAPLDEESIKKMLTVCVAPKISMEAHMVAQFVAAVNEYFFYGKERFEAERNWALNMIQKHDLGSEAKLNPIPNWKELVERFEKASIGIDIKRPRDPIAHETD